MKTLTLLAQKGGTGKTTLAVHLAVLAHQRGRRVVLIDTDPQASAAAWWQRRAADEPGLARAEAERLPGVLEGAAAGGFDLAVIDTAPHAKPEAAVAARVADLTVIPTRPAILDLDAIGASVDIVGREKARAGVVLNACPPPARFGESAIVGEARQALAGYGVAVCPTAVSQRAAMSHALIDGRAVTEFDSKGKAAAELSALWNWIEEELG